MSTRNPKVVVLCPAMQLSHSMHVSPSSSFQTSFSTHARFQPTCRRLLPTDLLMYSLVGCLCVFFFGSPVVL